MSYAYWVLPGQSRWRGNRRGPDSSELREWTMTRVAFGMSGRAMFMLLPTLKVVLVAVKTSSAIGFLGTR